jgi:hypothetical protein
MCHDAAVQTAHSIPVRLATDLEGPPELKLLIAWDDFANGRRAICFLERLLEDFGRIFTFTPIFLRFEDLLRPETAAQMKDEATQADLVVIAAYGDADLPVVVTEWIQNLGARKDHNDSPLVVLLSSNERGNVNDRPVQWRLHERAGRSGKNFLGNAIVWPTSGPTLPAEITWRSNRQVNARSRRAECPA